MFNPVKSVQTVSEFTASLKGLIETSHPFVSIQGEVSGLRIPYSGHMYFILKDDTAQIRAVLFKGQRRFLDEEFKDGDELICRGRISVYEPRGEYQIIVDSIQKAGSGRMHLEYAALKEKLGKEGYFDTIHKKRVPSFVQKICLITSPGGAAVHDFLEIGLNKHPGLQVEIIPTLVQGEQAASQITASIETACRRKWAEVIVLCRGGGSIEDLWCFNNETVAKTIFEADLPIVSAIGHEVDFTIADFVADLRAPTPTAAAEMIVPDIGALRQQLNRLSRQLVSEINDLLFDHQQSLTNHIKFLGDPRLVLDHQQLRLDYLTSQMQLAFSQDIPVKNEILSGLRARLQEVSPERTIEKEQQHLDALHQKLNLTLTASLHNSTEALQRHALKLNALSPLAVLGRGYSITTIPESGELISSVKSVQKNDALRIKLQDGVIDTVVSGSREK
jgi:exodeoxyribonuclease VII large subunit